MRNHSTVYVGLDLHKDSITVAYAIDAGEVELLGKTGTTGADIDRLCTCWRRCGAVRFSVSYPDRACHRQSIFCRRPFPA